MYNMHILRSNHDNFQDGSIEFDEFIRALSITSRGNLDEKLSCETITITITSIASTSLHNIKRQPQ